MKKQILAFAIAVGAFASAAWSGEMTDPRDGQSYRTVQIGTQTWMAENLNYAYLQADMSGDPTSFCYENSADSCAKYGRLYTWEAALNACPEGWHLPSKAEFETLIASVGGEDVAGKALKSTNGWKDYTGRSCNGTDAYGFSALPAGESHNSYGGFSYAGTNAYFWSAAEYNSFYAVGMVLYYTYYSPDYAELGGNIKSYGLSVRCLRDSRL